MSLPVILEVAANGVTTRAQNPAVPSNPCELAEERYGHTAHLAEAGARSAWARSTQAR